MIIRPGKFEAVILSGILICISFIFALRAENNAAPASSIKESVELPIIMYHHITESPEKAGRYTVLTSEFISDIQLLQNKGYTAVTVKELINYVNGNSPLPEKPIMITFDDGFESFATLAYPVLKKNNLKSVVSVIGSVTERYSQIDDHNTNYSNLNFDKINELLSEGITEIQNHSYDMHKSQKGQRKGISRLPSETEEQYKEALSEDLLTVQKILKLKCGITPDCVVLPFGAYSSETLGIIKKLGFKSTMLCEERVNTIIRNEPDTLFSLGRYNRESGITSEEFFSRFE